MRLQLSISAGQQAFITLFDQPNNIIAQVQHTYEQMSLIDLDFSSAGDIHGLKINAAGAVAPVFNMSKLEFCGK
jgi:hypothetical protein